MKSVINALESRITALDREIVQLKGFIADNEDFLKRNKNELAVCEQHKKEIVDHLETLRQDA